MWSSFLRHDMFVKLLELVTMRVTCWEPQNLFVREGMVRCNRHLLLKFLRHGLAFCTQPAWDGSGIAQALVVYHLVCEISDGGTAA